VIGSHASESYYHSYIVATSGVNRLAGQICHNRLFRKNLQQNILPMISTKVSSLAAHNSRHRVGTVYSFLKKSSDAGSRSSGYNSGESSHGGASNKASDRDRTKSRHGGSSDSTGTGRQSARELPPCLNTKKCAGEKHYLSDFPLTAKDEAIVLLSEYKKKRDADKKKANFKTLGNNRATSENTDGQTAYLSAENLGVKVTVLADTGSDYSALPRSAVEDARKRGFSLKVEVLPEPIMLNMAIRGEGDKQKCSAKEMLMSAMKITTPSGPLCVRGVRQIIVEEYMDDPLIGRPVLDEMGFVTSQHLNSVRDKFHLHDFSHIDEELLDMDKQLLGALPSFYSSLQPFQTLLMTCRMC
jgi:hypothetical protein